MSLASLTLVAPAIGALTLAEMREWSLAQRVLKPALAGAFVLLAAMLVDSAYGGWVLGALAACAVGDVLLLRKGTGRAFVAGMAAFGLGHLLYIAAFVTLGLDYRVGVAVGVLIAWFAVARPALANAPHDLKVPATAYAAIIVAMVAAAYLSGTWLIWPALVFAASDVAVARNRFGDARAWHPLAITPLYFGAQFAFALSVASF